MLTIDDIAVDDERFYVDQGVELPIELGPLDAVADRRLVQPAAPRRRTARPCRSRATTPIAGHRESFRQRRGQRATRSARSLWTYTIDTGFDNSPKAMAAAPGRQRRRRGRRDRVLRGRFRSLLQRQRGRHGRRALGARDLRAARSTRRRACRSSKTSTRTAVPDVIVGAAWGGRLIRAISGATGDELWTHDTDEYGDGGWVYQVDVPLRLQRRRRSRRAGRDRRRRRTTPAPSASTASTA